MATQPVLIALIRVRQECRGVRTSGIGWLVVSILAGILSSGVGAYVVTGIAARNTTPTRRTNDYGRRGSWRKEPNDRRIRKSARTFGQLPLPPTHSGVDE